MMQNGMAECKLCGSKTTNSQAVQHVSRAYDRQKVEPTLHSSLKILLVVGDCFFIGIQVRKKGRKKERKRNRERGDPLVCLSPSLFCILLLHGCKSGALGVGYLWYDVDLDPQNGGIGNVDERRGRFWRVLEHSRVCEIPCFFLDLRRVLFVM